MRFITFDKSVFIGLLLTALVTANISNIFAETIIHPQDTVFRNIAEMDEKSASEYLFNTINNIIFIKPKKAKNYIDYYAQLDIVRADSQKICYVYSTNGIICEMLGNYEEALRYDFKTVELAERLQDSARLIVGYTNIGMVYFFYNDQWEKAIKYYKNALRIAIALDNYGETSGAYSNIGGAFSKLDEIDSSIYYQQKALQIRLRNGKNSLNDQRAIALIYSNIASNFFRIDITDSAYYYINECIKLLNKNNYEFEVTEAYLKLSSFYKADNKIDSSMKYILKAIDIAKRLGLRNNLKNYLSYYADLLYTRGEYKLAYEQLNEHTLLSDTIHSQESRKKIAELQAQYDNESYLREIDKLEFTAKKEKLQKIIYTSSFVAILVIISGLLILVLIKKKRDKIISHQKEELLQKEKELAQIQQKELSTQLEYKNKQLTTHTLSMLKKNRFLQELDKDIRELGKIVQVEHRSKFKRITTLIKLNSKSDNEWDLFKNYFEEVNRDFYKKLSHDYPELSPNDYKICALIRLNMNIKESASILNISSGSLKTSRYRLRRKLNLAPKEDLHCFIQSI